MERPNFRELYLVFDNILSELTRHQSPYVQVLGTCYYDQLGPRVQVDSDALDLENIPANVDMRQLTTNSPTTEAAFGTSLPENGNGFLSVSAVAQPQSQDHSGTSAPVNQGLGVPLHLSRPRSWVGTSTAELGPRYVPAPLYCASPHSSVSNLTQETTFGSTVATMSPPLYCASPHSSVSNLTQETTFGSTVATMSPPLYCASPHSSVSNLTQETTFGSTVATMSPPLYCASPHSSVSNLTQETTFGSTVATMSPPLYCASPHSSVSNLTQETTFGSTVATMSPPLYCASPHSSVSNLTQETTFGSTVATMSPPLYCASPHSSVSNLTQETTFGSTVATMSPEHGHRLLSTLQSRSVGSLPLLTNPPALH